MIARPPDERRANARLIAAAPDLLRACKHARECIAGREGWGALEAVLDAAIAKAEPNP